MGASGGALFYRAEAVDVAQAARIDEGLALSGSLVEEEGGMIAGALSTYGGQLARRDMVLAGHFAVSLSVESVARSAAARVVEAIAHALNLVVVPLGGVVHIASEALSALLAVFAHAVHSGTGPFADISSGAEILAFCL